MQQENEENESSDEVIVEIGACFEDLNKTFHEGKVKKGWITVRLTLLYLKNTTMMCKENVVVDRKLFKQSSHMLMHKRQRNERKQSFY